MAAGGRGGTSSNAEALPSTVSPTPWSTSAVDGGYSSTSTSSSTPDGAARKTGWLKSWMPFGSNSPGSAESRIRQRAELYLARHFLDTVMKHGREIVRDRRDQVRLDREAALGLSSRHAGGAPLDHATSQTILVVNDLTEDEQGIFRRTSYYGWKEGMAAGLTTFGVLFGGLRWAAARRGGGGGLARTSAQLAMMPPPPRPGYQQLDGISAKRSAFSRAAAPVADMPAPPSSPSTSLLGAPTDVMTQLHFMCVGALSLVVGNLVAQACTDQERLFRQVERVPLLPGRSVLCHRMCPDLIDQHRVLLRHNSWEKLIYGHVGSASTDDVEGSDSVTTKAAPTIPPPESYLPDYTPADLLKDPETPELESVVHLLQNCRARIRYAWELQVSASDNEKEGDSEAVVTIPESGVPPSAIGIDSEMMGPR